MMSSFSTLKLEQPSWNNNTTVFQVGGWKVKTDFRDEEFHGEFRE